MELKPLSPELNELRNVIISSNLTTCFLILNELVSKPDKPLHYEPVRDDWIEMYKNVYKIVSKMKTRKSSRA
jgi:hypothetical protein